MWWRRDCRQASVHDSLNGILMTMEIRPLCPALGAEVLGIDLTRPLGDVERKALHQAFLEYHLLCLRAEPLKPAELARVARIFGEPQLQLKRDKRDAEAPEVSILDSTYSTPDDKPDDLRLMRLTGWHTDDSYFEVPAKATMLQAIEIPGFGGETFFCNTHRAYEELPEQRKQSLEGLDAVHAYDTVRVPGTADPRSEVEKNETPDVVHPLVRAHDESGINAIYFNANRTDRVVGMARSDSDRLLDSILEHISQDTYKYRHEWRAGDILVWDNRCLVHSVNMDFPVGQRRLHQRILLKGTRPVGPPVESSTAQAPGVDSAV